MADQSAQFSDYLHSESSETLPKRKAKASSTAQAAASAPVHDSDSLPLTFPDYDASALGIGPSSFSRPVQFQVPHFILGGPPNVAPGGGAEVMPGMFASSQGTANWFVSDFARLGERSALTTMAFIPIP